jgi:glycosyltransferase involved in cell wall biosynthesis
MRIAFYSPRSSLLQPGLAQGGDTVFLQALFSGLGQAGHEVEIVSHLDVRDLWCGRITLPSLCKEALAVRRRVRAFEPEAWLVYKPSRTYPDIFGWWQSPRRYVLLGAHTWQSRKIPPRWRGVLAWAYRQTLRQADVVTALWPATLERLRKRGVDPERSRLLFTAVPMPNELPSQGEARRRLGLPNDRPIVLSMTRFTNRDDRHRKTDMVLDLLAVGPSLPADALIVIGGDGPGRGRIETEVERLGLRERVRLLGEVKRSDTTAFFAAGDVYAQPHELDGPWLTVLEAQSCARPVVTMRTRSGELTVDEGRTGLLTETLGEFGSQLAALVSDRQRCAAMGKAARQFIADSHSMDVRVRQIEELLDAK